jgi:hypothetical protein
MTGPSPFPRKSPNDSLRKTDGSHDRSQKDRCYLRPTRIGPGLDSFIMMRIAIYAHLYVSDQRERRLQLPSGSSNWVEGTALIRTLLQKMLEERIDDFVRFDRRRVFRSVRHADSMVESK